MTAPLDIGLEQTDASLGGQDDVFDLETAERGIRRKRSVAGIIGGLDDAGSDESSEEEKDDDDDVSEGDGEAKIEALEAELDGLYDTYKQRLMDKDAKLKAKEAREKDKTRDEWRGIKDKAIDSDDDVSDDEEGGWDRVAQAKEAAGDDSSSESESESEEDSDGGAVVGKKRKLNGAPTPMAKKTRLITKLDDGKVSRSTQLWFDQDVFKGLDVDNIEDDKEEIEDGEDEEDDDEEEEEEAASTSGSALEVCWLCTRPLSISLTTFVSLTKISKSSPKTIPKMLRCGTLKASMKMKSFRLTLRVRLPYLILARFLTNLLREWPYNCRSRYAGSAARQSRKD